eukprot:Phypoly_transcript_17139.p1 GENE.Phypoly_transcript_17139~~Phypoly_transcript_17139.p1  ORF type:complete len:217 (+),score=21.34 Phypoly_transcript_17139:121-771(+)
MAPHSDLEALWKLFFTQPVPHTTPATAENMPSPYNILLPPNHHMTQTLEAHFKQPVSLHVIATNHTGDEYARAITLQVQDLKVQDHQVQNQLNIDGNNGLNHQSPKTVQFAIVRVDLSCFPENTIRKDIFSQRSDQVLTGLGSARVEILKQQTPLGRILKTHGIHTTVEVHSVMAIPKGNAELEKYITLPTYGRLAVIHCNGKPGLFLLEILSGDC